MSTTAAQWGRVLVRVHLPTLAMAGGFGMILPTIPQMAEHFDVTSGTAAQVVTASALGRIVLLAPAGIVVDRLGTQRTMVIGAAMSVLGTLIATATPSFPLLLLAMVFIGGGNSIWMLGREIAAIDMVSPAQRGRMLSSVFGISVAAQSFGPVIGGALTETVGFRTVYGTFLGLSALVLALGLFTSESASARRRRAEHGERFTLRLLDLVEPVWRATFLVLFVATFGAMLRNAALNSILPLYGSEERGLSPTQVGSLFAIIGVANLVFIGPVGFITDRWGRKAAIVPSAVFTALGFALYPFAQDLPQLIAVTAIMGIGSGLSLGSMTVSTFDIVPEGHRGIFQSVRRGVGETGALMGPAVAGIVTDLSRPSMNFFIMAPFYIFVAYLAIFVGRETHPLKRRTP